MSVRRLAEDSVQPKSFAFNRTFAAQAKVWVKKYPKGREQSAVIPLLMLAQEQEGWVTKSAIETIADMLGMPYIRALEVATFYTQFQLKPVGTRAHVQVCGTTPCMLRGSEALMDVCRAKIHPDPFHTNASGTLSWEEVECQGACVNAPMVMIFKDTFEDLTPERLAYIIDRFDAGRPGDITAGPQIDRIYSAPAGGPTTLKEDPTAKKAKPAPAKAASNAGAKSPAPTQAAKPKGGNEGALTTSRPVTPPEKQAEAKAAAGGKKASATKASATAAPATKATGAKAPATKASAATAKSVSAPVAKPATKAAAPAAKAEAKPAAKTPAKPAAAKAEAKPVTKTPAKPAAAKPQPVAAFAATAAAKPAAKAKAAAASPKAAPAAKAEATPSLADKNRPAAVKKPAKPDDLKMISGVGPKLEGVLNGLGIYTFAQVASWKKAERDWVDGYLKFKGRIERDDWVKQAKALAKGGRDEYVRVFGKEPR